MATRHDYLAYMHDTSLLLRWMIQTSNNIIKARKAEIAELQSHELNKTGQIRVDGIVPLCRLIAKHVTNVSPSIYRLFQSIIDARTASYSMFQRVAIQTQDKNVEKCNSTHKFFIDTLVAVLEALGSTPSKPGASQNADHGTSSVSKEEVEQLISANRFVPLQNGELDGSRDKEVPQQSSTTQPRKQARPGRAKKGKKGKKRNHKRPEPSVSEGDPVNLSLEDYKLIEEKVSEWGYMWAASDLARNWIQLRRSLQEVWRDVAYNHLNIAIGGTLSNSAIAMIQRRSRAIFVNFPDHDSYGSMNVVTWGLPYELQGKMLSHLWSLPQFRPDNFTPSKEICVDAKEQLMAYSYNYLVEFITDFQHTRSGKPTKRMLAGLNSWDPNLSLQTATKEECLLWRRSYTINWLYEMVNTVSMSHPQHRKVLGLQEFSAFVTLAMQNPGTHFRHKILPHHVFQLQLIMDSLTISRGWAQSFLGKNTLAPPADSFDPQHVIKDDFLNTKRYGTGLTALLHDMMQIWNIESPEERQASDPKLQKVASILDDLIEGLHGFLGQSKHANGSTMAHSRFIQTHENGLWAYSPFLCGFGLSEGLELTYRVIMGLWDRSPGPIVLVHLHNIVCQKGYLKESLDTLRLLESQFARCLFPDGKAPTFHFHRALQRMVQEFATHDSLRVECLRAHHQRLLSQWPNEDIDLHAQLDVGAYKIFNEKSDLVLYREAKWDLDRVHDRDLRLHSLLSRARLYHMSRVLDPSTGQQRLRDTELKRQLIDIDMSEEEVAHFVPETVVPAKVDRSMSNASRHTDDHQPNTLSNEDLLEIVQVDIANDLLIIQSFSGLNYLAVHVSCYLLFRQIYTTLNEKRDKTWMTVKSSWRPGSERLALSLAFRVLKMGDRDEECLQIIAEAFDPCPDRVSARAHIYWDHLLLADVEGEPKKGQLNAGGDGLIDNGACCVM